MLPLGPLFRPLQALGLIPKPPFTSTIPTEETMNEALPRSGCCGGHETCDRQADHQDGQDREKFQPLNGWFVVERPDEACMSVRVKKVPTGYPGPLRVGDVAVFARTHKLQNGLWMGHEDEVVGVFID